MDEDRLEVRRRQMEGFIELNKDLLAKEAFADAFVNILREANRLQPGPSGAADLARCFELVDRGATVTFGDLVQAALERILPPAGEALSSDKEDEFENALLNVALAGLSYLIENAAPDSVPKRAG